MDLYDRSIELIKRSQAANGSFPASPAFSTYQYCWLRDGTFTAYALDVAGEHKAAALYYRWVHRAILRHLHKFDTLLEKKRRGEQLTPELFWHCRYTIDGAEGTEPWGNFQLDGYGTYLWGVAEHAKRSRAAIMTAQDATDSEANGAVCAGGIEAFLTELRPSLEVTVRYLLEFWREPNFDCWEEGGDRIHPSSLAAVYGGLQEMADLLPDLRIRPVCAEIRAFVERCGVANGRFIKSVEHPTVDANLLWLVAPFAMFAPDDVRMVRTVEAIEAELCTGGVHRYPDDQFYGGGAWPLLTAWLGWYYLEVGDRQRAQELLAWVEAQADLQGHLPEQVPERLLYPEAQQQWVKRWGEPACPLLWSHAMYIVLVQKMEEGRRR
ncbi:glycosyl hydrolase [Tumebacillus algifaecis]|uniref:Glycosyl hydrolase n=1 Tax=Tumebacillus algifaecis TaxID=1214604 RepID=A0A223CW27_9BACL|nr:glycoside hydrolase family 15 protein [Tumebacillus algifaecis]ASS73539.1 glycosyl hydrolase [Tumebacillus algifaecis]